MGNNGTFLSLFPVSELKLDDVYFGANTQKNVRIIYQKAESKSGRSHSPISTHVVVYTPNRDIFLCREPEQAPQMPIILYAQGCNKESTPSDS